MKGRQQRLDVPSSEQNSNLLLAFDSTVILGFGPRLRRMNTSLFFPRRMRVMKSLLLFDERWGEREREREREKVGRW
jgi:hypothetical protein